MFGGHVAIWSAAVVYELDRYFSWFTEADAGGRLGMGRATEDDRAASEPDALLFVLALAQLLRATSFVSRETGWKEIKEALERFDQEVPHGKAIRDVLTHFDDYERGRGKMQKSGELPVSGLALFAPSSRVGVVSVGEMDLDILKAGRAAQHMWNATLGALHRYLTETDLQSIHFQFLPVENPDESR